MIPQLLVLALYAWALVEEIKNHGGMKPAREYNGYLMFAAVLIHFSVLAWGGFWK